MMWGQGTVSLGMVPGASLRAWAGPPLSWNLVWWPPMPDCILMRVQCRCSLSSLWRVFPNNICTVSQYCCVSAILLREVPTIHVFKLHSELQNVHTISGMRAWDQHLVTSHLKRNCGRNTPSFIISMISLPSPPCLSLYSRCWVSSYSILSSFLFLHHVGLFSG